MNLVNSYNPILRKPAKLLEIADIPNHAETFKSLHDTMKTSGGLGIAAPQVGLDLNAFVMDWMGVIRVCINPMVFEVSEETDEQEEGCLSFPGLRLKITRPLWAIVGWFDENGQACKDKLVGIEARVFLHEWDHVQGIVFTDRVGKVTLMRAKARAEKLARRNK